MLVDCFTNDDELGKKMLSASVGHFFVSILSQVNQATSVPPVSPSTKMNPTVKVRLCLFCRFFK